MSVVFILSIRLYRYTKVQYISVYVCSKIKYPQIKIITQLIVKIIHFIRYLTILLKIVQLNVIRYNALLQK